MNSLLEPQQPTRAVWRPIHVAEMMCLLAGLACIGWFGWNWAATEFDQSWSNYELNASLRGEKPTAWGYVSGGHKEPAPPAAEQETTRQPMVRPAVGATIGRVEMPRLKISAIVRYGSDEKTLKRAVGLVPGTALPGQPGNVGVAAHRDTFFRNLRGVQIGDRINLTTPSGDWEYEVESTKIVRPNNVEVLDPTPEPAMTLVTCYPFNYVGHAPKRFIVRARQITPMTEQQQAAAMRAPESTAAKQKSRARARRS